MKNLLIYFSWSNQTKKLVETLNKTLHWDIVRVERVPPYSTNYDQCAYVEAKEEVSKRIYPPIHDLGITFSDYDRILIFFPIWWYTFPMPIGTLIGQLHGYQGKVYLFANSYTNDPQYMENVLRDSQKLDEHLHFIRGLFNQDVPAHLRFIERME